MFKRANVLIAIALFAGLPCQTQFTRRTVTGIVTDKRGNTLPGAVVQLENTFDFRIRSCITDKDGRYRFTDLNGDIDFILRASYHNHWSAPKTLSRFNSSTHPEVKLVIPVD
jgi:Carboxypeptidase regulatory-like domain